MGARRVPGRHCGPKIRWSTLASLGRERDRSVGNRWRRAGSIWRSDGPVASTPGPGHPVDLSPSASEMLSEPAEIQDRLLRRSCGSRRGVFNTPRRDEHGVAAATKRDISDIAECVTSITTKNDVDGPNALDRTLAVAIRGPLRRRFRRSAYRIRLWRVKRGQAGVGRCARDLGRKRCDGAYRSDDDQHEATFRESNATAHPQVVDRLSRQKLPYPWFILPS